ncbi:MAG: succinylglutamate desuccinylase/aspartoacylase family protein [Deltaproteobacteria bacterium]|nr:succinylglutamate desuccinylase/aspartoacylase family protein [Deltaproteobacteria bacterium]
MRIGIYHRCAAGVAARSLLLGVLACSGAAWAAPRDAGEILSEVWLVVDGPREVAAAAELGLTVAEGRRKREDGRFEQRILASARALDALEARGYTWRVERADHRRGPPRAGYHTPIEGDLLLIDLAATAPRAGRVQLGLSRQGRPITGLWVGQPPDAGAPTWRVLGAHHGDEWSSFEVALDLAQTLAEGDGVDPTITTLLDESTVWVVPFVNPDGVMAGSRYNTADVDLNRNYDFEWSAEEYRSGDGPFSEPETRAVRTHALYGAPLASLSVHSGATNIGYVWNWTTAPTAEEDHLEALAERYADACTSPGFWVTNGADWYLTRGDTNDWSYGRYGGMDYTLEVTWSKAPSADNIPEFVAWHREATLAFLTAPVNLSGTVTDAATGAPLEARVTLERDGVVFYAHPVAGTFHRVAREGPATLRIEAEGYAPANVPVDIGGPGSDALAVGLEAIALASETPEPRRVQYAPVEVDLPGADGATEALLTRPLLPEVRYPVVDGLVQVDPTDLAPGPWTIVLDDGTTWPRALFVSDPGPAHVDDTLLSGDTLRLTGDGFAAGTRAWALWGTQRPLVPVPMVDQGPEELVMDLSGLPVAENVDLLVLSNGTQLAILDIRVEPRVDTGLPPDTGVRDGPTLERGGCGCAGVPLVGASSLLLLLPLVLRRRQTS